MRNPDHVNFLVLAAERKGIINPLAEAAGVSHKCLVPLAGKALIEHTLEALADSPEATRITVSIEAPEVLEGLAVVARLERENRLKVVLSGDNLYQSVTAALTEEEDFPAVITTADNVLLTPEMISHFCQGMRRYDAAVALTRKEVLLAKYPNGQRRFYKFSDGEFTNCNTYAIAAPKALKAGKVFEGGGQFVKSRQRMMDAFGLFNLILYKLAIFGHQSAIGRIGKRYGLNVGAVEMPFAEAPIDVDNERTAKVAEKILIDRLAA